jgi:hypothetical protein
MVSPWDFSMKLIHQNITGRRSLIAMFPSQLVHKGLPPGVFLCLKNATFAAEYSWRAFS